MSEPLASGSSSLEFDRAIPAAPSAAAAPQAVTCSSCARAMTTTYHTANGAPVCGGCRLKMQSSSASVKEPTVILKSLVFGFGAAVVGAVIYWAVMEFLELEIGIVAILTGYLVGRAMSAGATGRGGLVLQLGGAALVYVSVAMAYFPFAVRAAMEGAGPAGAEAAGAGLSIGAVIVIAIFGLALPVVSVLGSMPGGLISALIIGFGMAQAWKMLVPTPMVVEGPFKVGGTTP